MNSVFRVLSLGVIVLSFGAHSHQAERGNQKTLLSVQEAKSFCLETWFPKLRFGQVLEGDELENRLDGLLALYTDDIQFVDPNNMEFFGKEILKGKPDVRNYYRAVLNQYPKWEFSIVEIFPTEKGFVLRYEGKNAPPVTKFEGVDILELRRTDSGWKISKLIGYYDRKPFSVPPEIP